MAELLGIILFALIIAFSIGLHEIGHLVPAKRFGLVVPEYMIGFGPTIWSFARKGTIYGLKLLPLGGYVKIEGMYAPGTPKRRWGRWDVLADAARDASVMEPGLEKRAFYALPVHRRLVVMLGGPLMNLLLAFVFFAIVIVGIGLPTPSLTVGTVSPCVPSSSDSCTPSPAATAGLLPGDEILQVNGQVPSAWEDMTAVFKSSPGQPVDLLVVRDGTEIDLTVDLASIAPADLDPAATGTEPIGYAGLGTAFEWESGQWSLVPQTMWQTTTASVSALLTMPARVLELGRDTLVQGEPRSPDSPVSVVGASRLSGDFVALDQPVKLRLALVLSLAAMLNLFLFLFNLLPFPPLDGGQVAGALYEATRRGYNKLRRRPDPGPVDMARLVPVAYLVTAALVLMAVVIIAADLVAPLKVV